MRKLRAADLFCGAGGTTAGAVSSGVVEAVFALNHWDVAIQTHSKNFPGAKHVNSRLDQTSPSECPKIDLLFASPECTHHSRARGGRPTSDQQRSGAWDVMKWIEFHRPSNVVIENVSEFRQWGPVGDNGRPLPSKQGHFFDAWLMAIQAAGYKVDYRELNAADFGAATSRNRLFIQARKGRHPVWPEPSFCRSTGNVLPGMSLPQWRSASEVIDWSVPIKSIFDRSKMLADNTLGRLEAGLKRFVAPFVVKFRNNEHSESLGLPVSTITAGGGHHGLCVPFQYQLIGRGAGISRDINKPVPTMLASRESHGIAVPFISKQFGTHNGSYNPNVSVSAPMGSITTVDHHGLVIPWLSSFYGNETSVSASSPVATITTKDRHSLCIAVTHKPHEWPSPQTEAMRSLQATMRELGVDDLLFRMLQNHELSAAQGFDSGYQFCGTKAEVTKQIGNSVSPPVAKAISMSIAG